MSLEVKKDYEFYGFSSSNAYKVRVLFELLGITSFTYHNVDISKGEQFTPEFLKLNPNNKIPVIVDNTVTPPIVVFESGAILTYLAEKYESKLLPNNKTNPRERSEVFVWLSWQISTQGPFVGQLMHFLHFAPEKYEYSINRYQKEADRIHTLLDGHLATREYVAGGSLSIADVAIFGWALYFKLGLIPDLAKYPNISKWLNLLDTIPAFKNTFAIANQDFQAKMAARAAAQQKQE